MYNQNNPLSSNPNFTRLVGIPNMAQTGLKSILAGGAFATATAVTGPLTGNALAEPQEARVIQANATVERPAIVRAGEFGKSGNNTIGIMMYYGTANEPTAVQVGEFLVGKVEETGLAMGEQINADYFWVNAQNMEGIVITYHIGGLSIDDLEIREAFTPETLRRVIQRRQDVNNTIEMAALP